MKTNAFALPASRAACPRTPFPTHPKRRCTSGWRWLAGIGLLGVTPASAVQQLIGDVDGFGISPTSGLVRAAATHTTPADTDGDGLIEPGEFLPDWNKNGSVAIGSGDDFDFRTAAELTAVNGAQWTDYSVVGNGSANGATFTFSFPPPNPGEPGYGVDHYINFVFGDYDVSPASINIDGTTVPLAVQSGAQDGLVQNAYALVPWASMVDGVVTIRVNAPNEPYLTFDYALLDTDRISDSDSDGVPDALDQCPLTPAGVLFSAPVPDLFPQAPNLSCLIGIFENSARHTWKARLRSGATETVTLVIVATTVNTSESGAIRVIVTDTNGIQTITVTHPATMASNIGTLPLTLQGGMTYDVAVELVAPAAGPAAHHYAIGTLDRRLELGFADPLRYLEHEHQAWAFHTGPGEDVGIDIVADAPPIGGANQATSVRVSVIQPDNTVVVPSTALTLPATVSLPNYVGGTLIITVEDAEGHFRLRRQNVGCDNGFYLVPCPPRNQPPVALARDVTVFTGPDAENCSVDASVDDGSFDPDRDPITITQSPSGPYSLGSTNVILTVTDSMGFTSTATAVVTVIDTTPPTIVVPPAIIVGNDPGQCDAVVHFDVVAFDLCGSAMVTSLPASGTAFPPGVTIVHSTAVDAAGNTTSATFTVTVEDREAPVVVCQPTTNPAGRTIPKAGDNPRSGQNPDGFYVLSGHDNCADSVVAIYIRDSASNFVAGPFKHGDRVKITQAPGVTPNQKPMAGVIVAHIQLKGDALVYGIDAAGNESVPHLCLVPPLPK